MADKKPRKFVMPYQMPDDRLGVIRGQKYRRIPPKLVTERGTVENIDAENFAKKFPRLDEAAKMVALARMNFYGLPSEELNKFYGWTEGKDYGDFPEELVDQLVYMPESKSYRLRDDSTILDDYEPEVVQRILSAVGQDFPEGVPEPTMVLKHVKKDSVPEGTQFYPSTQQYLNDVLFSQGYAESDPIKEATYDLARKYLEDMAIGDTEKRGEERKYSKNIRKMLGKGEDEDYNLYDLRKHFAEGLFGPAGEFDATPGAGYWLQGMLDPTRAAVTQDPELNQKTSTAEKWARTGYDLGKLAAYGPGQEVLYRGLAKKLLPFAAHPVLSRGATGAVVGAALSPFDYLIGDPLFEKTTGYGATQHPYDVANTVSDAIISGGLGTVGAVANPAGRASYALRNKMVQQPAGSEALGAIKSAALEAGIKPSKMGKLVTKKMVKDELSGVPHNPPRGGAMSFADKAWIPYDKKYPNTVWKVEPLPEPTVTLEEGATELKPYGEFGTPGKFKMIDENTKFGKPRFNTQTQMREVTVTGPDGMKYTFPFDYGKPTPQFMHRYFAEHPELLEDMPVEFRDQMHDWLKEVVPYGSYGERDWFYGGKPILMSDADRRVLQNVSQESSGAAKAKAAYVDKNKQLGTGSVEKGEWKPADEKQTQLYEKQKKEYKLRKNLRELTPEEIDMYKKGHVVGPIRRGVDYGLTSVLRPAAINLYPTGSKVVDKITGRTTVPYSYEAYPEDK